MRERFASSLGVALTALGEADDALAGLPLTPAVRTLLSRAATQRTVLVGLARKVPSLTPAQQARFVDDTMRLADEARAVRRSLRAGSE